MVTSKLIFSKRKEGKLDEAYSMALELMDKPAKDEWEMRAITWCFIDIIKREIKLGQQNNLPKYIDQIKSLEIDPSETILIDQIEYILKLCDPSNKKIREAFLLSEDRKNSEALALYKSIYEDDNQSKEITNAYAREMYRVAKAMIGEAPANYSGAKKHLTTYLTLPVEKPSILHSRILWVANHISKEDDLDILAFAQLWDLKYLRAEDYKRHNTHTLSDDKPYPSLAEQVINKVAKCALDNDDIDAQKYILPFIDNCIDAYSENIWIKQKKARILNLFGKNEEALPYALEFTKNKLNDYWAWELLGDIHKNHAPDIALSCYCKSLLCSKDIKFVGKVKVKLAEILAQKEFYAEAKSEIEEVIYYRIARNQTISEEAELLKQKSWYQDTKQTTSNIGFYINHSSLAEELLYSDLPWIDCILGNTFCIGQQADKLRRTIYKPSDIFPIEIAVPESKISLSTKQPGTGIKIKGMHDENNRFQTYIIKEREIKKDWDFIDEIIGVVNRVSPEEMKVYFLVSKTIRGIITNSDLASALRVGDPIAVRMSQYLNKQGNAGHNVITANKTNKPVPESLLKSFEDNVRWSMNMGFTDSGIFVPPYLVDDSIINYTHIKGKAILSYNKNKDEWGWKAVSINAS